MSPLRRAGKSKDRVRNSHVEKVKGGLRRKGALVRMLEVRLAARRWNASLGRKTSRKIVVTPTHGRADEAMEQCGLRSGAFQRRDDYGSLPRKDNGSKVQPGKKEEDVRTFEHQKLPRSVGGIEDMGTPLKAKNIMKATAANSGALSGSHHCRAPRP